MPTPNAHDRTPPSRTLAHAEVISAQRGPRTPFGRPRHATPRTRRAGLFARANAVNTNNRLYPKRILLREVKKFVKEAVDGRCALGELDHPSYSSPTFKHLNLVNVSHQVLSVKWKGNALWGFIEVPRCHRAARVLVGI